MQRELPVANVSFMEAQFPSFAYRSPMGTRIVPLQSFIAAPRFLAL